MYEPRLNCIPDVEAFKKTLSRNIRKLALIFLIIPLPLVSLWIYDITTGYFGHSEMLAWVVAISMVVFMGYAAFCPCEPKHARLLSRDDMARFQDLVETYSYDQQIIEFVRNIHAQGRKPVNWELSDLNNYAVFLERQAKLEDEEAEAENHWQNTLAAVDPEQKEYLHE